MAARPLLKGRQTRAAILDAALALASHMGLEGLSIGALAEVTQMSKSGTITGSGTITSASTFDFGSTSCSAKLAGNVGMSVSNVAGTSLGLSEWLPVEPGQPEFVLAQAAVV